MRIYRSNGTTTYRYVYNGDQLSQMEITEEATGQKNLLTFSYDANGLPMTVDYDGTTYYFVTNLQGDVVGLLDRLGNQVVTYNYDAWGNLLGISGSMASTLGKHNPLRYRGYVYDSETNLYYLQSRYYDAEIGRFVNGDGLVSTGQGLLSNNMFAYCLNNPVNMVDYDGQLPQWVITGAIHLAITASLGAVGWAKFYEVKSAVYAAANAFLYSKGYTITKALFNKFMWGGSLSSKTINSMKQAFKNSSALTKAIKNLLKTVNKKSVNNLKGTVAFNSGDLYYGIHEAKFYITGKKQSNKKWKLTVTVKDDFNFDSIWTFSRGLSLGAAANDLGWAMQKIGMGHVYTWSVTFSKVY